MFVLPKLQFKGTIKSAIYDYANKNGKTYEGLKGFDPNAEEDHHDVEQPGEFYRCHK